MLNGDRAKNTASQVEVGIVFVIVSLFLDVEKKLAGLQAELHVPQRYQLPVYFFAKSEPFLSV